MWADIKQIQSSENSVCKFVYTKDNAVAERVLYKYPTYEERTVICCSTMSGCPVGCRFWGGRRLFCQKFIVRRNSRSSRSSRLFSSTNYGRPLYNKKVTDNVHEHG